jgi:hypothetical protein
MDECRVDQGQAGEKLQFMYDVRILSKETVRGVQSNNDGRMRRNG